MIKIERGAHADTSKCTILFDDDTPVITTSSFTDGDGTLRVEAVVDVTTAKDIVMGLKLLSVVRAATNVNVYYPAPPAPPSPFRS